MAIESELKFILDAHGYERILQWATEGGRLLDQVIQTNHYFDTPGLALAQARVMLRLRHKGGAWEMTFKRRIERPGSPGHHCIEIEVPLEVSVAEAFLAEPEVILSQALDPVEALRGEATALSVDLGGYAHIGSMRTTRSQITSPSGQHVMELDHSRYCGTEDFELECEVEDTAAVEGEVLGLLEDLGVSWDDGAEPKFARLISAR